LFANVDKSKLEELKIKNIVKYSLTPKYDADKIQFKFVDTIMKNEIIVRALPAIELILIIPSSYPSNQRPLIYTLSKFYSDEESIE